MTQLSKLSNAIADVVETVGTSIVRVRGRRRGAATGVVWDADHVVASHHAVKRDTATIGLPDGTEVEGTVVGRDPATDTAVIEVKAHGLPVPKWSETAVRTGHLVLVVGRPGRTARATLGMIGGVGAAWETPLGAPVSAYIDIDGTLPRGFTGGPLVGTDGKLVGLNTSIVVAGGTTIPTDSLKASVERALRRGSRTGRGFLGATLQPTEAGLLVSGLQKDGPGQTGGLLVGDIITGIAGEKVGSHSGLLRALGDHGPDAEVTLEVSRGGADAQVTVKLGTRPKRRC